MTPTLDLRMGDSTVERPDVAKGHALAFRSASSSAWKTGLPCSSQRGADSHISPLSPFPGLLPSATSATDLGLPGFLFSTGQCGQLGSRFGCGVQRDQGQQLALP